MASDGGPVMEPAVDGDGTETVKRLAEYFREEVEERARTVNNMNPEERPVRYDYEKGRLDQARIMHSLTMQVALVLTRHEADGRDVGPQGEPGDTGDL